MTTPPIGTRAHIARFAPDVADLTDRYAAVNIDAERRARYCRREGRAAAKAEQWDRIAAAAGAAQAVALQLAFLTAELDAAALDAQIDALPAPPQPLPAAPTRKVRRSW